MPKGENIIRKGNIMKFYTVDDLKNVLDTYPCSTETGYIAYTKGRLIEIIKQDFDKERLFLKQNYWNDEAPEVYGLNDNAPYSEEARAFAESKKKHGGGRNLIVMNGAYFSNARYIIENKYWDLQRDIFKKDTRTSIHNAVSQSVMNGNETELRNTVEQLQNDFLSKLNKQINSLNDFLKSKRSQFVFYLNFYKSPYVQRLIGNPTELIHRLDNHMNVMENGFQLLSIHYKKQRKFINSTVGLLSEKNYSDKDKINTIVDRIYSGETPLIQQLREIYNEFGEIKTKTYQLEESVKAETEERIKAGEGIYPDSLIIQHAKDNGLIPTSFQLNNK